VICVSLVVAPSCFELEGPCPFGDDQSISGTIDLSSEVELAEYSTLEVRWGTDSLSLPIRQLTFPVTFLEFPVSFVLIHEGDEGVVPLVAWLAADTEPGDMPRAGEPRAAFPIEVRRDDECRFTEHGIDVMIAPP
jgi:hypothetical protein